LLQADSFFQRMLEQDRPALPQEISEEFSSMVEAARKQASGGLISFGVLVSLYSVYTLARTLVEALNAAYEVGETRPAWKRLLLLVAFGPVLAAATITAIGAVLIGSRLAERIAGLVGLDDVAVAIWAWLRLPLAVFLLAVVLSVVYRFAPDVDQPYRLVTPGAAVAVIAWILASVGFSVYLANFADYGATYGSLGAAIGLLLYLYLSASVVLVGAEINAAIHRHSSEQDPGK
jgi:membrane protein